MSVTIASAMRDRILRAAKAVEGAGVAVRSYVLPTHMWVYWKILHSHKGPGEKLPDRYVYLDFTSTLIDRVGGRYLFGLVRDFESLGLGVCYQDNYRFLASFRHKTFKAFLLNRPFRVCHRLGDLPDEAIAAVISDRPRSTPSGLGRHIRLRYDEAWPAENHQVPMSFFVHPRVYDQWLAASAPDLDGARPWRVFFSGRELNSRYRSAVLSTKFGKLSRDSILTTLLETLPTERIRRPETQPGLTALNGSFFVWPDSSKLRIPQDAWLGTLDRAAFFLACPGMDMPLCHNLIEAMSRGAVPILEHAELLTPQLEHNVNCLVFRGAEGLRDVMDYAFRLSESEIRRLRKGVYAYYQRHHSPGAFAKLLLAHPAPTVEVFLNAWRTPRPPGQEFCN